MKIFDDPFALFVFLFSGWLDIGYAAEQTEPMPDQSTAAILERQ